MDKEAPGLIRMNSLAYLSGFPASFKETEQLRVKLPSAVTSKIKQVNLGALPINKLLLLGNYIQQCEYINFSEMFRILKNFYSPCFVMLSHSRMLTLKNS